MTVKMFWDATANTLCQISTSGTTDFRDATGARHHERRRRRQDRRLAVHDIGHASGDYYSIILYMKKAPDGSKVSERSEG